MKRFLAALLALVAVACEPALKETTYRLLVTIPPAPVANRLPVEAALFIPPAERAKTITTSASSANYHYVDHYSVGEALETAAQQAYSRIFDRLKLVERIEDIPANQLVLIPTIDRIEATQLHTGLAEWPVAARMTLRLSASVNGAVIWETLSPAEETGKGAVTDVVVMAFQRSAADLTADQSLRQKVAALASGRPVPGARPAAIAPAVRQPATAAAAAPPPPRFAETPAVSRFPRGPARPDDIAVIIGNADYARQGRDIPDVRPAHADAEGARLYAQQVLGVREGNLIVVKDATSAQMVELFGSRDDHRGRLFNWVKPGTSRVFVYYSGHGAPSGAGGRALLVPVDASAAQVGLSGYPLDLLYANLGKLRADSVTVVLEACFSGVSQAGAVVKSASPVFLDVKAAPVPPSVTVITAGAANEMASWEQDGSSGLFTKYFLKAMAGEADSDRDGRISLAELDRYLKETLTYQARRLYGRDQTPQIVVGGP